MNKGCENRKILSTNYYRSFIISIIIGILLWIFADKNFIYSMANGIKVHFELPFRSVENLIVLVCEIVEYSLRDILLLTVAFLFSCVTVSLLHIYLVMIYKGVYLGVSTAAIFIAHKINSGFPSIESIVIYMLFEIFGTAVLLRFFYHAIRFSGELRKIKHEFGVCAAYKKLRSTYCLCFLFSACIVITLNSIYCFLIYIT